MNGKNLRSKKTERSNMKSIIEVSNITKEYSLGQTKIKALSEINLKIDEGEFLSIIGPSGSGKTTLLNIVGLIDTPSSGTLKIAEEDIDFSNDNNLTDLRLHYLGFIFQTFNLIPVLNVLENVEFPLLLKKEKSKKEIQKKASDLLEKVGLGDHLRHRPAQLSGGQRQRVAIARALVTDPKIVLADEPTANLDSKTGNNILNIMKEMNKSSQTTFIFSTHDPDVLKFAERTISLKDGEVVK